MSANIDGNSLVPVRAMVKVGTVNSTTTALEVAVKDVLIAALSQIPDQATPSTTIAAIVGALKTIPAQA